MAELLLHLADNSLNVTFGEHHLVVPWIDVAPNATIGQRIYEDAVAYGTQLFEQAFPDESLRNALTSLRANERLLLVIDDPLVTTIPWEYLRDTEGRLLTSRLTLVRFVSGADHHDTLDFTRPLHIVAVLVSPVDDPRLLDTEGEWQRVVSAVSKQGKSLTLTRVRPPTLDHLERTLTADRLTLVHFMGHSNSRDGKGLLVFEDAHARSHFIEAADFAETLAATNIFLVVLNSCRSAFAWDWTTFGNIARGLVREGVPYALGMQFSLPDDAAQVLSQGLYDFLVQGRSIEEAVRRTRRILEHSTTLRKTPWLAGIPVLYTSLREQPVGSLRLSEGHPVIQPDPERVRKTQDLTALPQATHFVGRSAEISQALDALLAYSPANFVVLHGLGGIDKTSLARAIVERIGYVYEDCVLTFSFETFARLDEGGQRTINEQFADRFYNWLARYYGLDPAHYPAIIDLQQAILQSRRHTRSLLVLDNIETLIDSLKQDHPVVKALATFVSRLKEEADPILLTSRMMPPAEWGSCSVIEVPGLQEDAGAELFFALLPANRKHLAPRAARLALSQRVEGHPLSIHLLAGRFAETTTNLATFLTNIEGELEKAEQTTPTSLEDPERQKTLYACMDYSVRRLTPEQRQVLDTVSLFQAPFLSEFAADVLNDEEQTPVHLQHLVRLGLLATELRTFKEGELLLLDLHPMLRWYIQHHLSERHTDLLERYGQVYEHLASQANQIEGGYDQSSLMRYLVRQSLPDFEAALQYLPPRGRSLLAYHLAHPYRRLGQNRRALALYTQALAIDQELGDVREVALTQNAMANVLRQLGKPQEALALYEQSLRTHQELGDVRGVAVTQVNFSQLLLQQGEPRRALHMLWDAYSSLHESGFLRDAHLIQSWLISTKEQVLGPEQFNKLWAEVITRAQPEWLASLQASSSPEQVHISPEQLNIIVANTMMVMTEMPEKRTEWRETIEEVLQQVQATKQVQDTEFFAALLALLKGQPSSLPVEHPYAEMLSKIQADIAAGGPQSGGSAITVPGEVIQAVRDFVNAEDWDATRAVVEAQQELLFQPEVEAFFEQNIAEARASGEERVVNILEQHLALLRTCKSIGIAEAFEQLAIAQAEQLPFDRELIPRTTAALLGSPQEKMAHLQYLKEQMTQTTDERLKALLHVIQLALFSRDLSQLGRELQGVYRQAWEAITVSVEAGGVDPGMFHLIINNTLAVLGPASSQRSEWRDTLVEMRNQATVQGNRNMTALLDAVIRLLDAGGKPDGLGLDLQGIYAQTWQTIVQQLLHIASDVAAPTMSSNTERTETENVREIEQKENNGEHL